ncbi:helix-turn-helix domain-containing protein [Microbacterium sp. NPDC089987]|uniref:helix-turn-helix domain-containing protein n=1 Tax=Microbacterium sp. NPDC089987 TaxID=3364202 RepID=UPI0038158D59
MESTTYAEAVGRFLRAFRQDRGITMDTVAQAGREFGARWSLSSVQAIEGGKAAPTLPTLLTLALVLGRLSGESIRLADLLGTAEFLDRPYILSSDQPVKRSWVERVLSGAPVEILAEDHAHAPMTSPTEDDWDEELELEALRLRSASTDAARSYDRVDAMWDAAIQPSELAPSLRGPRPPVSLAESRAAKKLGIQPLLLQRHASKLWGHSLEAEAKQRAGVASTPQARGRVTRILVDEIRASLESED